MTAVTITVGAPLAPEGMTLSATVPLGAATEATEASVGRRLMALGEAMKREPVAVRLDWLSGRGPALAGQPPLAREVRLDRGEK